MTLFNVWYRTKGKSIKHWKSPMTSEQAREVMEELVKEGWSNISIIHD